jgi:hypothetical protein
MPLFTIDIGAVKVPIGDASNGLCGGMVFTVRDYYESGQLPPSDTRNPSQNTALYNYIVRRLFDSFNLPFGPTKYLALMNPALPDHETIASNIGLAPRGRAWIMIKDEWPKIKSDIDIGILSPLGLIELKSLDPFQMGNNHQVLAYRYELNGNDLDILVYDPNELNNDNVTITLNIGDPQHTTQVNYSTGSTVYCFFRVDYSFSSPPSSPTANVGIGDHFYTSSATERDNAIATIGYISEGTACYVFNSQTQGTVPLYRLLNPNNGDHFYTSSATERDNAIATIGYISEGTACYVFNSQTQGTVPLYRLLKVS